MNRKQLYVSPVRFQTHCLNILRQLGLDGRDDPFTDKPIRVRGKRRNGQHRGHRNSQTGATTPHK